MKNIIEQIAKENGVTAQEVEKDIQDAINLAMQNPKASSFWSALCPDGEAPTIEELVSVLATHLSH